MMTMVFVHFFSKGLW